MSKERIVVKEFAKKWDLSTEKERIEEFRKTMKEIEIEKPDTMIVLWMRKTHEASPVGTTYERELFKFGSWIYGEFTIKILQELTKEFEEAYSKIVSKGYELK